MERKHQSSPKKPPVFSVKTPMSSAYSEQVTFEGFESYKSTSESQNLSKGNSVPKSKLTLASNREHSPCKPFKYERSVSIEKPSNFPRLQLTVCNKSRSKSKPVMLGKSRN